MDYAQIGTVIVSLLGGGVGYKIIAVWLRHRREVGGDFKEQTTVKRDNFQIVIDNLQRQVEATISRMVNLEAMEKECRETNWKIRQDYEARLLAVQIEVADLKRDLRVLRKKYEDGGSTIH